MSGSHPVKARKKRTSFSHSTSEFRNDATGGLLNGHHKSLNSATAKLDSKPSTPTLRFGSYQSYPQPMDVDEKMPSGQETYVNPLVFRPGHHSTKFEQKQTQAQTSPSITTPEYVLSKGTQVIDLELDTQHTIPDIGLELKTQNTIQVIDLESDTQNDDLVSFGMVLNSSGHK